MRCLVEAHLADEDSAAAAVAVDVADDVAVAVD